MDGSESGEMSSNARVRRRGRLTGFTHPGKRLQELIPSEGFPETVESPGVRLYKECALGFWSCVPMMMYESASAASSEVELPAIHWNTLNVHVYLPDV
jgi:hypothetical protein